MQIRAITKRTAKKWIIDIGLARTIGHKKYGLGTNCNVRNFRRCLVQDPQRCKARHNRLIRCSRSNHRDGRGFHKHRGGDGPFEGMLAASSVEASKGSGVNNPGRNFVSLCQTRAVLLV
jgi:hypothetical protein